MGRTLFFCLKFDGAELFDELAAASVVRDDVEESNVFDNVEVIFLEAGSTRENDDEDDRNMISTTPPVSLLDRLVSSCHTPTPRLVADTTTVSLIAATFAIVDRYFVFDLFL